MVCVASDWLTDISGSSRMDFWDWVVHQRLIYRVMYLKYNSNRSETQLKLKFNKCHCWADYMTELIYLTCLFPQTRISARALFRCPTFWLFGTTCTLFADKLISSSSALCSKEIFSLRKEKNNNKVISGASRKPCHCVVSSARSETVSESCGRALTVCYH